MAQGFEDLLDKCVTKILNEGATVEECLANHPNWATELEDPLRLAASLAEISTLKPSPKAKSAALRRLQAEIES